MDYAAEDIAMYILQYYNCKNISITNLKLQKVLYYIQGEFYRRFGYPAFIDNIEAWKFGPVIPQVYKKYSKFASDPIFEPASVSYTLFSKEEINAIEEVCDSLENVDAWTLVQMTHNELPWAKYYEEGFNHIIPKDQISKFFRK